MSPVRTIFIWAVLLIVVAVPIGAAAMSPLLAWREPVYIVAGFAGVIAMTLLLFQPLLAAGSLPGITTIRSKRVHRVVGSALVLLVVVHVAGLWITSPPDVIDALLFVSPTPFSVWGVVAMWCVFAVALLVVFRRGLRLQPVMWRRVHRMLVSVIVVASVVHAMKIEGTMETLSKSFLCGFVLLVAGNVILRRRL